MKKFYFILCILGIVLPYWQFLLWVSENGLSMYSFFAELASTRIGAFAWLDVIVAAVVLIGFVISEGRRLKMASLWLPIAGTLTVGVSFGLPLFLLMREIEMGRVSESDFANTQKQEESSK